MRKTILALIAAFAICALSALACAQGDFITGTSAFNNWISVAFLAVLISACLAGIYYMAGAVVNNPRVRASAVNEFGQAIGTAVIVIIIVAVINLFTAGIFATVTSVNATNLGKVCSQLNQSQLDLLNPTQTFGTGIPSPTKTICTAATSKLTATNSIDYGLFATYIITANMTNQAANNMDALYKFEGWIGFASHFESVTHACVDPDGNGLQCILPIGERSIDIVFSFTPLMGFDNLRRTTTALEAQADLVIYLFLVQLVLIILIISAWPYMLAAGIILRSSMFTRRMGGLIIGVVIAFLLIFPTIYILEYSAFFNINGQGPIGVSVNSLPSLPIYERQGDGTVTIYGANSVPGQTGGYVPASLVPGSPCGSSDYVYEFQCGNPNTASNSCNTCGQPVATQPIQIKPVDGGTINVGDTIPTGCLPYGQQGSMSCPDTNCKVKVDSSCTYEPPVGAGSTYSCVSKTTIPSPLCPQLVNGQFVAYIPLAELPAANGPTGICSKTFCQPNTYVLVNCQTLVATDASGNPVSTPVYYTPTASDPTPPADAYCIAEMGANVDFFVFPDAGKAISYYSCLPDNMAGDELAFAGYYLIPFFGAGSFILGGVGSLTGQLPVTPSDIGFGTVGCTPDNAIKTVLMLANLYGAEGVSAYILPLFNLVIVLSAAIGLSSVLGGDTNLLGIGKLL